MKTNKTISNIKCHVGIHQFAGQQTLEVKKLKECTMEMNQIGVMVTAKQGEHVKHVLVPFTNITHIEFIDEAPKAKA